MPQTTAGSREMLFVSVQEAIVPRSRRSPHLVVLEQVGVHEHTQLSAVTKGRHAAVGLDNSLSVGSKSNDGRS